MQNSQPTLNCLNCATRLVGKHCHQCGQKASVQPFSLASLLRDIPHSLFHVDRGLFPTMFGLIRLPAKTINAYLDGQRVRFFNPLTFLAIAAGVQAFVLGNSFTVEMLGLIFANRDPIVLKSVSLVARWISLALLIMVPLGAWANWFLFRRANRNYAEHLVIQAYIQAIAAVLVTVPFSLLVLIDYFRGLMQKESLTGVFILALVVLVSQHQPLVLTALFKKSDTTFRTFSRASLAAALPLLLVVMVVFLSVKVGWLKPFLQKI
jgi:Protein of unknown function (DUF3667)